MHFKLLRGCPTAASLRRTAAIPAISAILVSGLGAAIPAQAQTAVFGFDGDPVQTPTKLTEVNNGMSATFSSPADISGGGFQVDPTFFSTLTGNVLHDRGPSGMENIPLNVSFSQQLYSISFAFATNDPVGAPASPMTLTAFFNGQQMGAGSATGVFQPSSYAEGVMSFSSTSPFNSVTLTSTPSPDFAVNNFQVSAVPAPEASTTVSLGLLLALGVGGLAVARRKRARA